MITYLETTQPNWKPFEAIIAQVTPDIIQSSPFPLFQRDPEYFLHDFMHMGTITDSYLPEKQIEIYKHCDTRRCLNIDNSGQCYAFGSKVLDETKDPWDDGYDESIYTPIETQSALWIALS